MKPTIRCSRDGPILDRVSDEGNHFLVQKMFNRIRIDAVTYETQYNWLVCGVGQTLCENTSATSNPRSCLISGESERYGLVTKELQSDWDFKV